MKTVFANRQVAHVWASRAQDSGRSSTGSFFFTGPTLYSYGSHFVVAHFLDNGELLVNSASYGNTTSKHQGYMRNALMMTQRTHAIRVNGVNDSEIRNLEMVRTTGDGKRLPDLAKKIADSIIDTIMTFAGSKKHYDTLNVTLSGLRSMETTAHQLRAYVAKGKRMPVWPLKALPETLPVDKVERDAWIASVAKGKLIEESAKSLSLARDHINGLIGAADANSYYDIQDFPTRIKLAWANLESAQSKHMTAHGGKASAAIRKAFKEFQPLADKLTDLHSEYLINQSRMSMRLVARDAFKMLRDRKNDKNGFTNPGYFQSKLSSAVQGLPKNESAQYSVLFARLTRIAQWDSAADSVAVAKKYIANGDSYASKFDGDAANSYRKAVEALASIYCQKFAAWHMEEINSLRAMAALQHDFHQARILEKNKTAVADWIKGERVYLPHEAGTYARINGDVVETSKGASVPVEHACRLARLARVAIRRGGQSWTDGQGPIVGYFRVSRIGADGSASIGCHDFDAAEGMRFLAVLESCEACAKHAIVETV